MTHIIEASASDVPWLSAFFRKAWKEAGPRALGWTGATDASIEEIASEEFLAALLTRPTAKVMAAEDRGEIIGVAVIRHVAPAVDELTGIVLLESRTGSGVGRSLLDAILKHSRATGMKEMVVRTEASNDRALRFYREQGFVAEAQTLETVEGMTVDVVRMRRRLV